MTLTKTLETMATVLPVEVVELMRGSFLVKNADYEINKLYDRVFPNWKQNGKLNGLYIADKCGESFLNIEDNLWNRACCALNDWLYGAYCEEYVTDEDDEE